MNPEDVKTIFLSLCGGLLGWALGQYLDYIMNKRRKYIYVIIFLLFVIAMFLIIK